MFRYSVNLNSVEVHPECTPLYQATCGVAWCPTHWSNPLNPLELLWKQVKLLVKLPNPPPPRNSSESRKLFWEKQYTV